MKKKSVYSMILDRATQLRKEGKFTQDEVDMVIACVMVGNQNDNFHKTVPGYSKMIADSYDDIFNPKNKHIIDKLVEHKFVERTEDENIKLLLA